MVLDGIELHADLLAGEDFERLQARDAALASRHDEPLAEVGSDDPDLRVLAREVRVDRDVHHHVRKLPLPQVMTLPDDVAEVVVDGFAVLEGDDFRREAELRGERVAHFDVDALSLVGEGSVLGIDRDAELSALAGLGTLRSRRRRSEGQRRRENAIPHRWCRARRGSPTSLPGSRCLRTSASASGRRGRRRGASVRGTPCRPRRPWGGSAGRGRGRPRFPAARGNGRTAARRRICRCRWRPCWRDRGCSPAMVRRAYRVRACRRAGGPRLRARTPGRARARSTVPPPTPRPVFHSSPFATLPSYRQPLWGSIASRARTDLVEAPKGDGSPTLVNGKK